MKQPLLTIAMFMAALFGAQAQTSKTYTDKLTTTMDYTTSKAVDANVEAVVNNENLDMTLKDFSMGEGESALKIGDLVINGLTLSASKLGDFKIFAKDATIEVNGFGPIPSKIKGQIDDARIFFALVMDLSSLGMSELTIEVGQNFMSKTYTDFLTVTINEITTEPQSADVTVISNEDGTMDLTLKNFMLEAGDDVMPVGNIAVKDLVLTPSPTNQFNTFERTETIFLGSGDPEISDSWMSSILNTLGGVPIILKGQIDENRLYVTIDIDMMASLTQIIYVKVGEPWEEVDGITNVSAIKPMTQAYDLSGRPVDYSKAHGVIIVDGKKIVK